MPLYLRYYKCPSCSHEWEDKWDNLCDDRCPECRIASAPVDYDELDVGDENDCEDELGEELP